MIDQRNFAISQPEFKVAMGTYQLMSDNSETSLDDLTIPVEHYIIDFHALYLFRKLTHIRTGKPMTAWKRPTIQEIISNINRKFGYDIENHVALQRIIDTMFSYTQVYFSCLFAIYMICFAFCFIAQMQFTGQPKVVSTLNGVCLGTTILFQFLSFVELINTPNKMDFFDKFNIINNCCYIMYYVYFTQRQHYLGDAYLPRSHSDDTSISWDFQAMTSIMTIIILTGIIIKSMDLVRFDKNMGKLVQLVFAVLYDVRTLFFFLVCNICIFALFYLSLGYKLSKETDVQNEKYWDYFIESWKIATKGSRTEISSVWVESGYSGLENFVMLLTIFNEIYLKIIMLSFLIAIVKKTFDTQMKIEKQNIYEQRSDMNKESSTVFNQIGLLEQQDMFILSCQFESPPAPDKIDKFQKEMRGEMDEMKKMIKMLAENQMGKSADN